ncbi:type II toxin-antitoxin system RelE/ParE family toxin [Rhizobium sp. TRM95796]|nr:type II toxin-antitoxin system RelE/ParE family toxin [Rhizobium sp. TRM95796]MCV3765623.1 type II toxin-antitoxin system RelE/ParE family toxin [Rhizobium sp. TRM95796]
MFVYGFEKSDRGNIGVDELETIRDLARDVLALDAAGLKRALAEGRLKEIDHV